MASQQVAGAQAKGVYAFMKHFALNDQETNRLSELATWANEQSIREIYLKPFEMSVKQGGAGAVMSAFNYIGMEWGGSHSGLLNTVLRGEWGFRGMAITDYDGSYGYMISENCVRNGNDLMLGYGNAASNQFPNQSATGTLAMRNACKNIMYTIVNSGAYAGDENPVGGKSNMDKLFMKVNVTAGVVIGVIAILVLVRALLKRKKMKAAEAENAAK